MTLLRITALALLFFVVGGCSLSLPQYSSSDSPAQLRSSNKPGVLSERQLQAAVMVFSDHFSMIYWQAADDILRSGVPPTIELAIEYNKVLYTSSALNIAVQPNPTAALLDMITFVRLGHHAVRSYWVPEVLGPEGKPLLKAYGKLEEEVWILAARVLSTKQQEEVRVLIDKWRNEHPNQWYIAGIHGDKLPTSRGKPVHPVHQDGEGLLNSVSQGLVKVDEAMMVADRALFLGERLPRLLILQGEVLVAQITKNPLVLQVTNDMSDFKNLGNRLTQSFEELPQAIRKERQQTLDDFFTLIEQERVEIMRSLVEHEGLLLEVLGNAQTTLATGSETAKLYTELVESIRSVMVLGGFDGSEVSVDEEDALSRVNDLLLRAEGTADKFNSLIVQVNRLLSPQVLGKNQEQLDTLLTKLVGLEETIIAQVFWYCLSLILITILFIFILCIAYRLVTHRLDRRR